VKKETVMFELEKAITSWRKRMEANPALEPGYIAELEARLRDLAVARFM
jgi:hypothetical protein